MKIISLLKLFPSFSKKLYFDSELRPGDDDDYYFKNCFDKQMDPLRQSFHIEAREYNKDIGPHFRLFFHIWI